MLQGVLRIHIKGVHYIRVVQRGVYCIRFSCKVAPESTDRVAPARGVDAECRTTVIFAGIDVLSHSLGNGGLWLCTRRETFSQTLDLHICLRHLSCIPRCIFRIETKIIVTVTSKRGRGERDEVIHMRGYEMELGNVENVFAVCCMHTAYARPLPRLLQPTGHEVPNTL
jgi:hypothetical protein